MNELKIIATEADIAGLEFGDSYVVDPGGLSDDPVELIESKEWAEAERLEQLIAERFTAEAERPDNGNNENNGNNGKET